MDEYPIDLGTIPFYVGDAKKIVIELQGLDFTGKYFVAQVRVKPRGPLETSFSVSSVVTSGSTTLTLALTGDSTLGNGNGQTRQLGPGIHSFDVQRFDSTTNAAEDTMFIGTLLGSQDVTR